MHNDDDIVITGLACRFAETANPVALWRNIFSGKSLFTRERAFDFGKEENRPFAKQTPSYAARLDRFYSYATDAASFPSERKAGENGDLVFALQMTSDALNDSDGDFRTLPASHTALHIGYASPFNNTATSWMQRTSLVDDTVELLRKFLQGAPAGIVEEIRDGLCKALPEFSPNALGSAFGGAIVASIAERLRITGPAENVDTGFLSGHTALMRACDDLRSGRADVAVAGAIQPPLSRAFLQGLGGLLRFTADDCPKPFSKDAAGTLPGEGGALFVLKRRSDAKKAGNRVYASIENVSTMAPRPDFRTGPQNPANLADTMCNVMGSAGVEPVSVRLVETIGCAVPELDAAEINAMRTVFDGSEDGGKIGFGSLTCNVGHTLWASSAAGTMKAVLALYHRILPPSKKIERLNAKTFGPLYWIDEPRPWLSGDRKNPRRALVNAVDYTGSCSSLLLSE